MGFKCNKLILPANSRIANLTECIIERELRLRGLPITDKSVWFASLQGKTGNVTIIVTIIGLVDNNIQVIEYWKCDETLTLNVIERYPDEPVGWK